MSRLVPDFSITQKLLENPLVRVEEVLTGWQKLKSDWVIAPRILPEYLLYYISGGNAEGLVAGQKVQLEAGSIIWLAPGVQHEFAVDKIRLNPPVLYHFRFGLILPESPAPRERGFLLRHGLLDSRMLAAMYYDERKQNRPDVNNRVRHILALLLSDSRQKRPEPETGVRQFDLAARQRLFEYVRAHIRRRPSPADLASALELSPDYFSRVFRASFGVSPRSWLVMERIKAAAEELQSSTANISEIAERYGYKDIFRFSKQFRRVMKCSPTQWRLNNIGR